jgi:hypothetical protein
MDQQRPRRRAVDATKPDETRHAPDHRLSVAQLNAVDCLAGGQNDRETAAAVGVSRQTVTGWRRHNPFFQAALNARRREVWGGAADRLRALLPRALTVVEEALAADPDPKLALEVLKLAGLGDLVRRGEEAVGPDDPEAIVEQLVRARRGDPFAALAAADLGQGPVTEEERRALLAELAAKAADVP